MEETIEVVPQGWSEDLLGNLLNYEQPYKYTVDSTDYDDKSGIPVLTAGKSFILGYTAESNNVYGAVPVIIFDDFTTDSKYVDFRFKVKSSAMKFLKPKNPQELHIKVIYAYLQTLKMRESGSDHKRRWISEFSKLKITFPPFIEQSQIASILSIIDEAIKETEQLVAKYSRIKTGLIQDFLTKGIDENGKLRNEKTHQFVDSPLGLVPKEWEVEFLRYYVKIQGGFAFKSKDFVEDGVQLIRMGNLYNNELSLHRDPVLLPTIFIQHHQEYLLKKGDLIMSMTGTAGKRDYGFTVEVKIDKPLLLNQRVCRFMYNQEKVDKSYLIHLLHSELYLSGLYENASGTKQANLNADNILNLFVPFPPKNEQVMIGERLDAVDSTISMYCKELAKFRSLKIGLSRDLLSGKVRVKTFIKKAIEV